MLKVLLVRPKPHKDSLGLTDLMTCEPLELEYVSSVVASKGHVPVIVDMMLEKHHLPFFIRQHDPDLVLFTSYITHVNVIKTYASQVKQTNPAIITAVGGVHSEVMPDDFISPDIDYIVGINGLKNVETILDAVENGLTADLDHENIDWSYELPSPDRSATFKYRKHYDYAYHVPCALLKTSFGCPYSCRFCFCVEITKHKYCERSLKPVIAELKNIDEPNVFIVDDNFLVSKQRIKDFCRLLDEHDIHKKFIVFGRADFIAENPDYMKLLAKHGLDAVFVGVESFKQDELNDFNKKCSVEVNEAAAKVLHDNNIDLYAGAIVGPDWDKQDFSNFVNWIQRMHVRFVNLQPLVPLPGTAIYDEYASRLLIDRSEYEKWDLTHLAILPTKLSPTQYYIQILLGYFRTSASISSLRYIRKKCGVKTEWKCFKGATKMIWHYIKLMWQYRNIKIAPNS